MKTAFSALVVAAMTLGSAAAWAQDTAQYEFDEAAIAAAKAEGSVTLYSTAVPDSNDRLAAAFQQTYGITVNVVRASMGPLMTRIEGEFAANNPQADVLIASDINSVAPMTEKGYFDTIEDLPVYAVYPESAKGPTHILASAVTEVILYNTDAVQPSEITEWADVLDPKFANRIAIVDPRIANTIMDYFKQLGDMYGEDFLRQLAQQKPQPFSSVSLASQLVASGEALIAFPAAAVSLPPLKAAGAPVDSIFLGEPNIGPVLPVSVMKNAPHPNAARLLVNFLADFPGQTVWNGGQNRASYLPGFTDGMILDDTFRPADEVSAEDAARILNLLGLE